MRAVVESLELYLELEIYPNNLENDIWREQSKLLESSLRLETLNDCGLDMIIRRVRPMKMTLLYTALHVSLVVGSEVGVPTLILEKTGKGSPCK